LLYSSVESIKTCSEYVDRAAKEAAKLRDLESIPIPISFEVAKAVSEAHIKERDHNTMYSLRRLKATIGKLQIMR
jgi:hypothetical protein